MVVIQLGYDNIIVSKEDAMALVEILERGEIYERKYWNQNERTARGIDGDYTFHVYPNDKQYQMNIVSESHYQMAKLAGKPEKE